VFADLAEAVEASEGKEGCPLNDEFADKLLDSVSPAVNKKIIDQSGSMMRYKIRHEEVHIGW